MIRLVTLCLVPVFAIGLAVSTFGMPRTLVVLLLVVAGVNIVKTVVDVAVCLVGLDAGRRHSTGRAQRPVEDCALPSYTVLCPVHDEVAVVPQLVLALSRLSYPPDRLQILFLVNHDDTRTLAALDRAPLEDTMAVVRLPADIAKTKPAACNEGLARATGEIVVIFDAEDIPDPEQLRLAAIAFRDHGERLACVQAQLRFYNDRQNWITRLFAAEYAQHYQCFLWGLQTWRTVIPLGGTSNHLRTRVIRQLGGWDPMNVTEDCELGVRLHKAGYRTRMLDSITWEEANSDARNWVRQRSRWMKGYVQTWLKHATPAGEDSRAGDTVAVTYLTLIRTGLVLVNVAALLPSAVLWVFGDVTGGLKAVLFVLSMSMAWGNAMYVLTLYLGFRETGLTQPLTTFVFLPLYYVLAVFAVVKAFYQLAVKPSHWEKTVHGLHLQDAVEPEVPATVKEVLLEANQLSP